MRITSFGLFWRQDEIEWHPGQGVRESFRLLGRIGSNTGKIKIADFRRQQGIYILYDQYGPTYVGLTRDQGLGKRLKDHHFDRHKGKWDRFSWFGFWPVCQSPSAAGIYGMEKPQADISEDTNATIGDLEALLIKAMGTRNNRAAMNFKTAREWTQIASDEIETYLPRVKPAKEGKP